MNEVAGEDAARTEGYDLGANDLHNHGGAWSVEDHDRLYPTCAMMYGSSPPSSPTPVSDPETQ